MPLKSGQKKDDFGDTNQKTLRWIPGVGATPELSELFRAVRRTGPTQVTHRFSKI